MRYKRRQRSANIRAHLRAGGQQLYASDWGWAVLAWLLLLVIRLVCISLAKPFLNLFGDGLSWADVAICTWAGLRGAVGLSLALIIDLASAQQGPETERPIDTRRAPPPSRLSHAPLAPHLLTLRVLATPPTLGAPVLDHEREFMRNSPIRSVQRLSEVEKNRSPAQPWVWPPWTHQVTRSNPCPGTTRLRTRGCMCVEIAACFARAQRLGASSAATDLPRVR